MEAIELGIVCPEKQNMAILSKCEGSCADILHPYSISCSFTALEMFFYIFRACFKIYGSVYFVSNYYLLLLLKYFKIMFLKFLTAHCRRICERGSVYIKIIQAKQKCILKCYYIVAKLSEQIRTKFWEFTKKWSNLFL